AGAWGVLFERLEEDHSGVDVRWDGRAREELKQALDAEVLLLDRAAAIGERFAWNHQEFRVEYPSIAAHLSVDGVFLVSALAAARAGDVDHVVAKFPDPARSFLTLYRLALEAAGDAAAASVYLGVMELLLLHARSKVEEGAFDPPDTEDGAFDPPDAVGGSAGAFSGVAHLVRELGGARDVRLRDAALCLL
ncbi:hypothetical protein T484DRAFT_1853049, partial [Baffinella frigidus]